MASTLVQGLFVTGPDDDLTVADIYSLKSDGTDLNQLTGGVTGGESNPLVSFSKNEYVQEAAKVMDLLLRAGEEGGGLGCIKPVNEERISNSAGGVVNLNRLCGKTATGLLDSIANLDLNELDSIQTLAGNAMAVTRGVEATEVSRIVDLVKQYTGNAAIEEIHDLAASMGIRNTLIKEVVGLGVFDLLDSLFEKEEEVDRDQTLNLVGTAIKNGDHRTVARLVRLLGRDVVLAKYPDIISEVLRAYRFPLNTTSSDYDRLLEELKTSLMEIDPAWYTHQRNGSSISDLTNFRYASPASEKLLLKDSVLSVPMLIAKTYFKRPIEELAKSFFPYVAA